MPLSLLSTPPGRAIGFSPVSSSSLNPPLPLVHSFPKFPTCLSLAPSRTIFLSVGSSSSSSLHYTTADEELEEDEEEHVIGDCLVFEDGIFEDPVLQQQETGDWDAKPPRAAAAATTTGRRRKVSKETLPEVEPQNLVPDEWKRAVEEINITKKERRQIARELEYGQRLDRRKKAALPLRVNLEDYLKYRDEKLSTLKPVVLDEPSLVRESGEKSLEDREVRDVDREGSSEEEEEEEEEERDLGEAGSRVEPKNPRWAVYGRGLDDISEFFNSGNYQPNADNSEGRRQLFTKEDKILLNAKRPDLAAATSEKWLPLHALAASGEFYLAKTLLKHVKDINAADQDGLTALQKAITSRKYAMMNFLLREAANPFYRDKDGATLMHYAVRTASIDAIKTLLLYNVDINLQDNEGWSPLHLAVQTRRSDVVRLLLIKGADKTLKNQDGLTPLQLCLHSGRDTRTYELIKLLKTIPWQRDQLRLSGRSDEPKAATLGN